MNNYPSQASPYQNHLPEMSYGSTPSNSSPYDSTAYKEHPYTNLQHPSSSHTAQALINPAPRSELPLHHPHRSRVERHINEADDHHRPPFNPPAHALYPAPPHLNPHSSSSSSPSSSMQHSPVSWTPFDNSLMQGFPPSMPLPYGSGYHDNSSYSAPRLSPPPSLQNHFNRGSDGHGGPRLTLAGSLDPATGIFYRTPEHPRLRTAQACEKCRTRKAKCSGEHPSCNRCLTRGLLCEYAKEGRMRGPNKPKIKTITLMNDIGPTSQGKMLGSNISPGGLSPDFQSISPTSPHERTDNRASLAMPPSNPRRHSLSLSEHRSSRPRPPDLHLGAKSSLYRLDGNFSNVDREQSRSTGGEHTSRFIPRSQPDASYVGNIPIPTLHAPRPHLHLGSRIPTDNTHKYSDDSTSNSSPSTTYVGHAVPNTDASTYMMQRSEVQDHEQRPMPNPHSVACISFSSSPASTTPSPTTPVWSDRLGGGYGGVTFFNPDQQQIGIPYAPIDRSWENIRPNSEFDGQFRRSNKFVWENATVNDHDGGPHSRDLQIC